MKKYKRPQGFCRWNSIFDEWDSWLKNNNLTPLEACVRYAFSVKEIDKIVIGIDSLEQLCEILSAKNNKLEKLPSWPQEIDSKLINPAFWSEL
jgi:predicted aldo/keto reductase-like oxidoreductase